MLLRSDLPKNQKSDPNSEGFVVRKKMLGKSR